MTVRAAITPEKYAMTESERTEGETQRHSTNKGICLPGTASGKRLPISEISVLSFNDMRKDTMTKNNKNQNYQYMTRRIGSTTYKVKVVFSDNGGETLEEKILRMIRNEGLQNSGERGTMDAPQMSRQSERSAS